MKRRILHVITTINRGGAENHLRILAELQVRAGYDVHVIYLKGNAYWKQGLEQVGVSVYGLGLKRSGDMLPVFRLAKLLAKLNPDLVHAHLPAAELYVRAALLARGDSSTPVVISKHNDEPFAPFPGGQKFGSWVAARARRVIAISGAVETYIAEHAKIAPHETISVVHYGLSVEPGGESARLRLRQELGLNERTFVIGAIARLVPQKALHVLLEAFASHVGEFGDESALLIAGEGPLKAELQKLAADLKIAKKVHWLGFREDALQLMHAFDVFALSSIYEGFGLVLLEAMAAALPVVATKVSAIPEIIEDGVSGILVPPNDAGAMARAFGALRTSGNLRPMGHEGRRILKERFSPEAMLNNTERVYQLVLNGH